MANVSFPLRPAENEDPWFQTRRTYDIALETAINTKQTITNGSPTAGSSLNALTSSAEAGVWGVRHSSIDGGAPPVTPVGTDDPLWLINLFYAGTNSKVQVATNDAYGTWIRQAAGTTTWANWRKLKEARPAALNTISSPVNINEYINMQWDGSYAGRVYNMLGAPAWFNQSDPSVLSVSYTVANGVIQMIHTPTDSAIRMTTSTNAWGAWRPMSGGGNVETTTLAVMTDSMYDDYGSLGHSAAQYLTEELGLSLIDGARSGHTPTEIAWRHGSLCWYVNVPTGTVPATGSVACEITPSEGFYNPFTWTVNVTCSDGVTRQFKLVCSGSSMGGTPTWTISQESGTGAVRILKGSRVQYALTGNSNRLACFAAMGRNDANLDSGADRLRKAIRAMIDKNQDSANRIVFSTIWNRRTEPKNSEMYNRVMRMNDVIREEAGDMVIDMRQLMIDNGLTIMGLSPTPEDIAALADDCIPESLMYDITHPNLLGRQAMGKMAAAWIKADGWFRN